MNSLKTLSALFVLLFAAVANAVPNVKISELPTATTITTNDLTVLVSNGSTRKASLGSVLDTLRPSSEVVAATNGTAYNLNISSGNGGGLTNLQATNIVFQDLVWSGTGANDESDAIIDLNNGYQRYEYDWGYFIINSITPSTGKPRWTSFKLHNISELDMNLEVNILNSRPIGSASPFTIPDGKVAWITIHDDGQGTAWSITYAVAIEP